MSMLEFLSKLRNLGIRLRIEKGELRYEAPRGSMTPELLRELSQRKSEVISFLQEVNREAAGSRAPILRVPRDDGKELPLTYSQQSMWFIDQFTKGNPVFNISNAIRVRGNLEISLIEKSLEVLIGRHEPLRTTFLNRNGKPVQVINPTMEVELSVIDLQYLTPKNLESELRKVLREEARRTFDLEKGPLFRFRLFITAENEYVLSMTIHHIIADAWSNVILVEELFQLYKGFQKGETVSLPEPAVQFADYAVWEQNRLRGEELERLLGYWRKQLANPVTLKLPTDRARPKRPDHEGGFQPVSISKELSEKLKALANREGATLFMILLAAFQTLLHRYSGQEEIFTGTVTANRNRKEIEKVTGFFINTLVLRTNFGEGPSFLEILRRVREMTYDAYTYQELPFDKILEELKPERDPEHHPVVSGDVHPAKQPANRNGAAGS